MRRGRQDEACEGFGFAEAEFWHRGLDNPGRLV
jgi:hypothetical protein